MVSVLASNAVDRWFELRSGQTKNYTISICCFSTKHATLRRKKEGSESAITELPTMHMQIHKNHNKLKDRQNSQFIDYGLVSIVSVIVMVFNATFSNITIISWRSVLLVEETGITGENHRPAICKRS
jgi:hypothetical protein